MMARNRSPFYYGLLLYVCFISVLYADEKQHEVSFAGAEFPLILQNNNGQPKGLAVSVIETICQRLGCIPVIKILPWKRAQTVAYQGQVDILIGPYINAERQQYLEFGAQYFYTDRMRFYVLKSSPCCWDGYYEDLKSQTVAASRGWHFSDAFEQHRPDMNLREVNTPEIGFQMLLYKRVNLVASHERQAKYDLERLQLQDEIVAIGPEIGRHDGYFAFSKRSALSADFKQRFNQELARLWLSGELATMSASFGLSITDSTVE